MKNNFRIINLLRIFFNVLYTIAIVSFVMVGILFFIQLFIASDASVIPFRGIAFLKLNAAYDLLLGGHFTDSVEVCLELRAIKSHNLLYRFMAFFNIAIIGFLVILLLKNAKYIFGNLHNRKDKGSYFSLEIYSRIRKIGFLMLMYFTYLFISGALISCFLLDHVSLMGQEVHVQPDYTLISGVINVLVVFVFAEIYRAGIDMKEESELTI